jgi:hypothetical protein
MAAVWAAGPLPMMHTSVFSVSFGLDEKLRAARLPQRDAGNRSIVNSVLTRVLKLDYLQGDDNES